MESKKGKSRMKKREKWIILAAVVCVMLTGCQREKNENQKEAVYENSYTEEEIELPEEITQIQELSVADDVVNIVAVNEEKEIKTCWNMDVESEQWTKISTETFVSEKEEKKLNDNEEEQEGYPDKLKARIADANMMFGYQIVQVGDQYYFADSNGVSSYADGKELNLMNGQKYSFGKDYEFINYRIVIDENTKIASIGDIYPSAAFYENEIKELFGVKIDAINLDYHNKLYRIDQETPFKK